MSTEVGSLPSLPENWRGLNQVQSRIRPVAVREVEMLVLASTSDLTRFSTSVWQELDNFAHANGIELRVTEEQLQRYFATAIGVRVCHVTRDWRPFRRGESDDSRIRIEDHWALPPVMANVVAAIGNVRLDKPGVSIVPRLAEGAQAWFLSRAEWQDVSAELLSLEPRGIRFAHAIESKREGIARVMTLTAIGEDEVVEFVSHEPFTPVDAWIAASSGLRPAVPAMATLPLNPFWTPPYFMERAEFVIFEQKFSEIGHVRASA